MKKRRGLILSFVIILLMGVSGYWFLDAVRAKYKLSNGKAAYNQGNYDEAVKLLGDAVRLDPKLPEAHQYYVATLFAKYDLGEGQHLHKAMDEYLELLRTKSSGTDAVTTAVLNIADFAHRRGWKDEALRIYDEAIAVFEREIESDPQRPQLKRYYGATLYAKYELAHGEDLAGKALEVFRQIHEEEKQKTSPDKKLLGNAGTYLALIHQDLADSAETEAEREERMQKYQEWLLKYAGDPHSDNDVKATAYYSIGTGYWRCAYEQSTRYSGRAPDPFHPRNFHYQPDKQKFEECVARGFEYIEKALAIKPDYVDALFYKGLLYREKQKATRIESERKQFAKEAETIVVRATELTKQLAQAQEAAVPSQGTQVGGEATTAGMIALGLDTDAGGRAIVVKINQFPVKDRKPAELLRGMLPLSEQKTVYIRASQNAPYGEVAKLFGIACEAGASSVELQLEGSPVSQPQTTPPPPTPLLWPGEAPLFLLSPPPPPPAPPPSPPELPRLAFGIPGMIPDTYSWCESPSSQEDLPPDPFSLVVTISQGGGGYKLNTEELKDLNALGERLFMALNGRPSDRKKVVIAAADNTRYGEVVKVFEVVKKAEASPISLQADDLPASQIPGQIPLPSIVQARPVSSSELPPPPPPPPAPMPAGTPGPPKKISVSGGILQGSAIKKVQPPYPPIAQAANARGAVQVYVTVSEEGRVIEATVVSGHPLLRDAALQAARQWVFKPTELSGAPVKVQGVLTFNFPPQ